MTLHDIERHEQFKEYYAANNLNDIDEKIDNLTRTMKIRATRCDETEGPEEILAGLEETALFGNWKVSW
jgi:hypothetical protein